jgi:hypothetical protein
MATQKTVVRLSEDMLRELEKMLNPPFITDRTTELQAGFTMGQQSVLKMLRDGYTIGT